MELPDLGLLDSSLKKGIFLLNPYIIYDTYDKVRARRVFGCAFSVIFAKHGLAVQAMPRW
jgi:hypothetical protein